MSDELDDDVRDRLVAAARGAVSLVPFVGGPLSELISHTIPNLRQDRIVAYLRELAIKLDQLEEGIAKEALSNPLNIDAVETGGYQAARATSSERVKQIAEIVFKGLQGDAANAIRRKRLLTLFGELDDDEVAILNAYGQSIGGDGQDAWANVDRPFGAHLGSSPDEVDREKLYELGIERLLSLGLLKRNYRSVKKGELPEFDARKGTFKNYVDISYLGRMLLREIELPSVIDR